MNTQRLDAADELYLRDQLRSKRVRSFHRKYPDLKAWRYVPLDKDREPGAKVIPYHLYDYVGRAKIITNYANDIPRVDLVRTEYLARVVLFATSFGYTFEDIHNARLAGESLPERKVRIAEEFILRGHDHLVAVGDKQHNVLGFVNHPNVSVVSPIDVGGGVVRWNQKTPEQVIADLKLLCLGPTPGTHGLETPDTLILPPEQFGDLQFMLIGKGDKTVLEFLMSKARNIRNVDSWEFLSDAGLGGTSRAISYRRDDTVLEAPTPIEFSLPMGDKLEVRGLEVIIPAIGKSAGTVVHRPKNVRYMDGI